MRSSSVLVLFVGLFALGAGLLVQRGDGPGRRDAAPKFHADDSRVYTLDFRGPRHTLAVTLWPTLQAQIHGERDDTAPPMDLEIAHESGYPLRVRGNGQRSVLFVHGGGRSTFDRVRGYADMAALRNGLPKSNPYPSPGLRGEQAVEGTVFLAKLRREAADGVGPNMMCVLLERVGDASLTLRIAPGPRRLARGHWDASFHVRVRGRLVDKKSGRAHAGAWLLTLPERGWGTDGEIIAQYREYNTWRDAMLAKLTKHGVPFGITKNAPLCAAAVTDTEGRFDVVVKVPWSINHVDGRRTSPATPPPRSAVEELRVEIAGQEPRVLVLPKTGPWTEHPEGATTHGALWATWDLGDVAY
ncbi:MAG: hypothetical protein P1V36_03575 [Planctomycetota bacterium]|nr:hypothetical protein [Planctomycetota bacterium]